MWRFGLVLAVGCCGAAVAEDAPLRISVEKGAARVLAGDDTLMRYAFEPERFKPCVDVFVTPGGVNVLRDSPHDHVHHHALMFAIKVNGVNFWEERETSGRQAHVRFSPAEVDRDGARARLAETLRWLDADGAALAHEERVVELYAPEPGRPSLLSWTTTLRPDGALDRVELGGNHYHGLGMRFLVSMDHTDTFRFAADAQDAEQVRGSEYLRRASWCAFTADADGKQATVAMFDHPSSTRFPALWFTMHTPFNYLSATRNLWREPLEATAQKPAVWRHGVALWDGEADDAAVEAAYQTWLGLCGE